MKRGLTPHLPDRRPVRPRRRRVPLAARGPPERRHLPRPRPSSARGVAPLLIVDPGRWAGSWPAPPSTSTLPRPAAAASAGEDGVPAGSRDGSRRASSPPRCCSPPSTSAPAPASAAKGRPSRSAPPSPPCSGAVFDLSRERLREPDPGRRRGRPGRGLQHADRRGHLHARGDPRATQRPSRSARSSSRRCIASVVERSILGEHALFSVPPYRLNSLAELPFYLLLGVVAGARRRRVQRLAAAAARLVPRPEAACRRGRRPAAGGLVAGRAGLSALLLTGSSSIFGVGYQQLAARPAGQACRFEADARARRLQARRHRRLVLVRILGRHLRPVALHRRHAGRRRRYRGDRDRARRPGDTSRARSCWSAWARCSPASCARRSPRS